MSEITETPDTITNPLPESPAPTSLADILADAAERVGFLSRYRALF
jgi:hypothetical protein